jgi:hypothetical protein
MIRRRSNDVQEVTVSRDIWTAFKGLPHSQQRELTAKLGSSGLAGNFKVMSSTAVQLLGLRVSAQLREYFWELEVFSTCVSGEPFETSSWVIGSGSS